MNIARSPFSFKRSLRVDLLTAFGGLLLATVLVTILFFYINTSQMVLMLCDDIMEQTTQMVVDCTLSFFEPVSALTEVSARAASAGVLPLSNSPALERYSVEVLKAYPAVARFIVGDRRGNFLLARRLPEGTFSTKNMDRTGDAPFATTTWRIWDKNSNLVETEINTVDAFDPRSRPWYQGAELSHGLYITDLYIFYTDRIPGVTISCPVENGRDGVLGVMGCDIELSGLSSFLKSLRIGQHGLALIINEKDTLVAFPDGALTIDERGGEQGIFRTVFVDDLQVPGVAAVFGKYRATGDTRIATEADGHKYLATIRSFPTSFQKTWKVVVLVPEDDFIGEVKKLNLMAFFICIGILGIAMILVVLLSRDISRPILSLAAETDRIRNFELDGSFRLRTHISEILQLQEAVDRMRASLRSFTRFAPEQIVKEVVVRGKEAMLGGERKDVTLLFSDLRNFTRFSEQTHPEQVVQILNAHFDAVVRIIAEHGGFVVDFLGDSLFVVFGAPGEASDHADQAVSCAIDMQLVRHEMNEELERKDIPLMEMGIGINSGPCVVGNMGSRMRIKYGVVGHTVNLASRLESFAVGGQVLISESTCKAVRGRFEVAGPLEAYGKGVESAIRLWEVRGILGNREKSLPTTSSALRRLVNPVSVRFRLVTGKQIGSTLHEGKLIQLSRTGAELEASLSLEVFSSIQVVLPNPHGESAIIDGRVVAAGSVDTSGIIRFSPPGKAGGEVLNFWLNRG